MARNRHTKPDAAGSPPPTEPPQARANLHLVAATSPAKRARRSPNATTAADEQRRGIEDDRLLWKLKRTYTTEEWKELQADLLEQLEPLFPEEDRAELLAWYERADPAEIAPSIVDSVNAILDAAYRAISTTRWLRNRRTNRELQNEKNAALSALQSACDSLSKLSGDFRNLLPLKLDVDEFQKQVEVMRAYIEAVDIGAELKPVTGRLARCRKPREVDHEAAREMALAVLRVMKDAGIEIGLRIPQRPEHSPILENRWLAPGLPPRGDEDAIAQEEGEASDSMRVLKRVGRAIGMDFAWLTWRRALSEAMRMEKARIDGLGGQPKFVHACLRYHDEGERGDHPMPPLVVPAGDGLPAFRRLPATGISADWECPVCHVFRSPFAFLRPFAMTTEE